MSILSIIALSFTLFLVTQAYTTQHMDTDNFDVSVNVDFDAGCSSHSDFSIIVSVARGASILNVLEHSNVFISYFQNFKVAFGVHSTSYTLISINGEGEQINSTCAWHVSTSPVTSTGGFLFPLSEVFVTNVGMSVTFHYTTVVDKDKKQNTPPLAKLHQTGPSGNMDVTIKYTQNCPDPNWSDTTNQVTVTLGESALNVLESAARQHQQYSFVVSNIFGAYYKVHSLSSASSDPSGCKWCEYYTPPSSTEYSLTADINNFVIPVLGGELTLKYELTCGSAADNLYRYKLNDFSMSSHYNPFMHKHNRCNEQEDGSHCRAN